MANVFSTDPLAAQLDKEEAAILGRSLPRPATTPSQPQSALSETGTKTKDAAPARPPALASFEGISEQSAVPVNVLLALTEARGAADEEQALAFANASAQRMSQRLQAGERISDLVAEELGDPSKAELVLQRARDIGASLYPQHGNTVSDAPQSGSFVGDRARQLGGALISATGATIEGAGRLAEGLLTRPGSTVGYTTDENGKTTPYNNTTDGWLANAAEYAGDQVRGWGETVKGGVSQQAKDAMQTSTPDGELFAPSTWTFGEAPSLAGYSMLAADVLGSFLPVVAASMIPGGGVALATGVGASQGAGSGAETARDIVRQAAEEKDAQGVSTLFKESAYYREALARGLNEADALQATEEAAANTAAAFTAPISAFGGAATSKIIGGGVQKVAQRGIATRVAGTAALSGIEEGVQEAAESMATRFGTQTATGIDLNVAEGTFGDFILGAVGGAPVGAATGAMSRRQPVPGQEDNSDLGAPPATPPAAAPQPVQPPRDGASPQQVTDYALGRMTELVAATRTQTMPDGTVVPGRESTPEERAEYKALSGIANDPDQLAQTLGITLAQPKGRLETALDTAAPSIAPGMAPRQQISVVTSDGEVFDGEFLAEDAQSLAFLYQGERIDIPRDEIESGNVVVTTRDPAGQPASQQASQPETPPADDIDLTEPFDAPVDPALGTPPLDPQTPAPLQQPEVPAVPTDDELGAAFDDALSATEPDQPAAPQEPQAPATGEGYRDQLDQNDDETLRGFGVRAGVTKRGANDADGYTPQERADIITGLRDKGYVSPTPGVIALPLSPDEIAASQLNFIGDEVPYSLFELADEFQDWMQANPDRIKATSGVSMPNVPKGKAVTFSITAPRKAGDTERNGASDVSLEISVYGDTPFVTLAVPPGKAGAQGDASADAERTMRYLMKADTKPAEGTDTKPTPQDRTTGDMADITKKDGSPFTSETAAARALKARQLDADLFDVVPMGGGFVARPKPLNQPASQPASEADAAQAFLARKPNASDYTAQAVSNPVRPESGKTLQVTFENLPGRPRVNLDVPLSEGDDPAFTAEILLGSFPTYADAFKAGTPQREALGAAYNQPTSQKGNGNDRPETGNERSDGPAAPADGSDAGTGAEPGAVGQGAATRKGEAGAGQGDAGLNAGDDTGGDTLRDSDAERGGADTAGGVAEPDATKPRITGYTFKLADRLSDADNKAVAKWRGTSAGDVISAIDGVARRAETALRRKGEDIRDYDETGRNALGQFNQMASVIAEAQANVENLLEAMRAAKTGDLDYPTRDEDTGEYEYDGSAMADALDFLLNVEANGLPMDGIEEPNAKRDDDAPEPNLDQMDDADIFPKTDKSETFTPLQTKGPFIPQAEAKARVDGWKKIAADIGATGQNDNKVVISLFDYTGAWSQPWADAGYQVLRLDIKSGTDALVDFAFVADRIAEYREAGMEVVGVLSACPCTTFSGAGARWWQELHDVNTPEAVEKVFGRSAVLSGAKSPLEYNIMLYEATRDVIAVANPSLFHVLENPIGRIQNVTSLTKPALRFHPSNFGDPYTKQTQLFGTINADLPLANVEAVDGSKMQSKYRGDDPLGKEARSTTPEGFAYAFFMGNDPDARKRMNEQPKAAAPAERQGPPELQGPQQPEPTAPAEPVFKKGARVEVFYKGGPRAGWNPGAFMEIARQDGRSFYRVMLDDGAETTGVTADRIRAESQQADKPASADTKPEEKTRTDVDRAKAKVMRLRREKPDSPELKEAEAALRKARQNAVAEDDAKPTEPKTTGPKIEDFGEKIGGARKDRAKRYGDELAMDRDTESMTLAEAFPQPDYAALIDAGHSQKVIAALALLRGHIERKPLKSYKVRGWARDVDRARTMAAALLNGDAFPEGVINDMKGRASRAEALEAMFDVLQVSTIEYLDAVAKYDLHPYFRGQDQIGWGSKLYGTWRTSGPTFESMDPQEIADAFAKRIDREREKAAERKKTGGRKPVELQIRGWRALSKGKWFVGFKGPSGTVELQGGFDTAEAAREFMTENKDELLEEAERLRDGLNERLDENRDRKGPKYRMSDATPEMFTRAFGFRGVEFGNWVEGKARQDALNRAFDALTDLAGALGVPTGTLSLDGKLGLGFGSRGRGGRNPAAAHFEPTYFVMNLTKINGAGSLAHEWFHAVDNYLAKVGAGSDAATGAFATDAAKRDGLEQSERKALIKLSKALKKGPWFKRSQNADNAKSKPYFSTTIELAARAFEKMIVDRLAARGMHNDYLANIDQGSGAYPTTEELIESGGRSAMNAVLANVTARLGKAGGKVPKLPDPTTEIGTPMPAVGYTFKGESATGEISGTITSHDPLTDEWIVAFTSGKGVQRDLDFENEGVLQEFINETVSTLDPVAIAAKAEKDAKAQAEKDARDAKARAYADKRKAARDKAATQLERFASERNLSEDNLRRRLLFQEYNFGGDIGMQSRAEMIIRYIEEGATIQKKYGGSGKETLRKPDGAGFALKVYTELGVKFAKWLIEDRAKPDGQQASTPTKADIEAAAAQADTNATDGQKEAGNYRKGHITWNGYDLSIETAKGEDRTGKDSDGEEWSVTMPAHYGDIKGTTGADGDPLDFYMGDMPNSDFVLIVNQIDLKTGAFDEHKIILGTGGEAAARRIYEAGFSDGKGKARIGSATATNVTTLQNWITTGNTSKPTEPITAKPAEKAPAVPTDDELGAAFDDALAETEPTPAAPAATDADVPSMAQAKLIEAEHAGYATDLERYDATPLTEDQPEYAGMLGDREARMAAQQRADAFIVAENTRQGGFLPARWSVDKPSKGNVRIIAPNGFVHERSYRTPTGTPIGDSLALYAELRELAYKQEGFTTDAMRTATHNLNELRAKQEGGAFAAAMPKTTAPTSQQASKPATMTENVTPESAWDAASTAEREAMFTATGWANQDGTLSEAAKRNIERDWAELTPTAKGKIKEAVDAGTQPEQAAPQRGAGEAAKSAASNAAQGFGDIAMGLSKLLGGTNKLNSGLTFDKDTYKAAKPYFIDGLKRLNMAGADIKDMMLALIRALRGASMTTEEIAQLKPYAMQFVKDVTTGEIDLAAEIAKLDGTPTGDGNDTSADSGNGAGTLEGTVPGQGGAVAGSGAGSAGGSSGSSGGSGDTGAAGGGSGSPDSLGGRPKLDGPQGTPGDRGLNPPSRTGDNPGNYPIPADFALGGGTDGQKIKANMAAIQLVKKLDAENRFATPEEQKALAAYVGWGGLRLVFDPKKTGATDQYGRTQAELKELLTPDELSAAEASTRDAHYTSRDIVGGIWAAMQHFGFKGGRALEPTMGTGNFLGLQPEALQASTEWHGVEMDAITGRIAYHLYPDAAVMPATPFQNAPLAEGVFDVAVGNPPFGSQTPSGGLLPEFDGMKIHHQIIAKSGHHLRPGGIMGFVVTHRFLDTPDKGMKKLAEKFRFIGAVRLPNDAFKANAGTEVTTDIVFMQKLRPGEKAQANAAWLDTNGEIDVDGQKIRVNRYFQEHPDHIIGRSAMDGTMYGAASEKGEYTVHSDGRELQPTIEQIVRDNMADEAGALGTRDQALNDVSAQLVTSDMPIGGMALVEDKILRRDLNDFQGNAVLEEITPESFWADDARGWSVLALMAKGLQSSGKKRTVPDKGVAEMFEQAASVAMNATGRKPKPTKAEQGVYDILDALATGDQFEWSFDAALGEIDAAVERKKLGTSRFERLKAMLDMRNQTLGLIQSERQDAPDIEDRRKALNKAYDAFVKTHGYISDAANVNLTQGDVGVELGLESSYTPPVPARKADAAKGIEARKASKASADKAAILSARVNYPFKAVTSAKNARDGVKISLSERGKLDLPFIAQLTGMTTSQVIEDLKDGTNPEIFFDPAQDEYVHAEEYLSGNVKDKLSRARAKGMVDNIAALEAVQPEPLPQSRIQPSIRGLWIPRDVFKDFLTELGVSEASVAVSESGGLIKASGKEFNPTDFGVQFKDPDKTVTELFNAVAAGKAITIRRSDGDGGTYEDKDASKRVTALADRMGKAFKEWAYTDADRAERIVNAYNEKMNTHVKRIFDGRKFLNPQGTNPNIKLRRTQVDAAWRMVQSRSVLLDHVVGAGKTFTAITGVMERRRLGLSRKPMIVVPNHLVLQWARDFYNLYPGARILAATPADFTKSNRRRLFARLATGDYDAIIIGHSSLSFIETPRDDQKMLIDQKMAELKATLDEMRRQGESGRTLTQIQNRIEKYREKLGLLAVMKRDEIGIDLADMGVDHITVDEAQEFKNLEYVTGGERVVGMNDPKGSKKAFDLYGKIRGLQNRDGGVAFATGTPVSNSLVEIFTVMSYLSYDELKKRNQHSFDAWSAAYAATETRMEYTATQKLKPRRVLAGLNNLSSLSMLYEQFADIITMDTLKRLYTEEREASNKASGKNDRTDFPVPKVKGGGRQLDSAPLTESQQLYMDYLVARMQKIESNAGDKEYAKIDNPLWVLSDARKMSLDIRTVDPTRPRDPGGKVARSADKIKAIYDRWTDDKGTQLVFSDLSTPSKNAEKDARRMIRDALKAVLGEAKARTEAKAIEALSFEDQWKRVQAIADDAIEAAGQLEDDEAGDRIAAIEEHFAELEDPEAAMSVADVGFSVYDDLRSLLIEKGIPSNEIAFIHDYNTPEQKAQLFGAVNRGDIRVLLGSSMKMGAGTNAQERLVALHHLDAPWRPSDVEQREGRIIRQGNKLYMRDPDGFEVEIYSYSTDGSSDTVFWQILERKAGAIEQFRSGSADNVEEEGGDSDQYAEFMATSTGNPVFRYKLEAERELLELRTEISGLLMARSGARRFMDDYDSRRSDLTQRIEALQGATPGPLTFKTDTGTEQEFKDALTAAQTKYEADYAAWLDKRAAAQKRYDELEAKGGSAKDITKMMEAEGTKAPAAPAEPGPLSKTVAESSGYARAMRAVLTAAGEIKGTGEVRFQAGDMKIVLKRVTPGWATNDDTGRFTLTTQQGGLTFVLQTWEGQKPVYSNSLQDALMPDQLAEWVKEEVRYRQETVKKLDADLPRNRDLAAREVNEQPVADAKDRLDWYTAEVALAESRADNERAKRPNSYVTGDRKRGLKGATGAGDKPAQSIELGGETFNLTGLRAPNAVGMFNEAKRASDNRRAIVLSKAKADKTEYVDVRLEPEAAQVARRAELRRKKPKAGDSTGTRVKYELQARLAALGLTPRITLQFADTLATTVDGEPRELDGYQMGSMIAVALDSVDPQFVLDHEALHAFRNPAAWNGQPFGVFTQAEWSALARSARADKGAMRRARRDYPELSESRQVEEVIANQFAAWSNGRRPTSGPVSRAFRKLRAVFEAIRGALTDAGIDRRNAIFRGLENGTFARRPKAPAAPRLLNPNGGLAGPVSYMKREDAAKLTGKLIDAAVTNSKAAARSVPDAARGARRRLTREGASNAMTDAMRGNYSVLGLVPGRALFVELGKSLPGARLYLKAKEEMDALRNEWHARTDDVSQDWRKLIKADPEANAKLMELMHRSTLAGIDPSGGFKGFASKWHIDTASDSRLGAELRANAQAVVDEDKRRKGVHNDLRSEFEALPRAYRDMYRRVRDEYAALANEQELAVLEHMEKSSAATLRRADETYAKRKQDIADDSDLTKDERAAELADAKAVHDSAKKRHGWTRKAKIAGLRAQFEANRLKGPYFPLARFGDYFVTVRDKNNDLISFSLFETQRQQKEFQKEVEAMGHSVTIGVMSNKDELRGAVDPNFVADVEEILADAQVADKVMDDVWQRWLQTLPDMSIRTNRIHRKGRKGFNTDAYRAFGKQVFHGAHQLARLKYSVDLDEALTDTRAQAAKSADPNRASMVVNEMAHRHEFIMNPTGSSWATTATSAAFVWYLSVTPAAAIVNLSQTTVLGIPMLGAAFSKQGARGSAAALTKAAKDFTLAKGQMRKSKRLSADELGALDEAYRRGTIDRTQAHDLAGVAETGVAYNDFRTRWMGRISWFFHNAEVMNREVTFLAAYRMARKDGLPDREAVDKAAELTWNVHFDYQNTSRPRVMQGDTAKVLLTFRNFSVNMLWRLMRDSHQALQGASAEERSVARKQLLGITASMALHAGITGTWGYGLLMMMFGMFFPGGDDEAEEVLKKVLVGDGENELRKYIAGLVLNGVPGQLTGISLSERLGMPDLWFRDSYRDLEGQDWYLHMLTEIVGPVPGIAESMVRGWSQAKEGEWRRGFETAAPKFIRDGMRAERYATEGVTTLRGDSIIPDVNAYQVLVQALGFTPAQVAERYSTNSRMLNIQNRIEDRRGDILKELRTAIIAGEAIPEATKREWKAFNSEYPEYAIKGSTLKQSVAGKRNAMARNEYGASLNPRLNRTIRQMVAPLVSE